MEEKQVSQAIVYAVMALLFTAACWISIHLIDDINEAQAGAELFTDDQNNTIHSILGEKDGIVYSGSQVLFTLRSMTEGDYDVTVNGMSFPKNTDPDTIDPSIIDSRASYRAAYSFQSNGSLSGIDFSKVR